MRMSFKTFFVLAIPFALFLFAGCDASKYPSPKLESVVESSIPAFSTNSEALASAGGANIGQVVEVTGVVTWIANKGGRPVLQLSGNVTCGFGKKQKQMISTLRIGDRVTLRGIYDSAPIGSMGPYLTPCIRVR
jgi:hypothetical protein